MFFSPSAAAWLFRIIFFSSAARPTSFLTSFLLCLAFIQHAHSLSRETWFFHTLRLDSTRLYIYDVSNNVRLLGTFHCETSAAFFLISCLSDSIFQHWTQNYPLVFQLFHHTQSNLGHSSRFVCTLSSLVCAGLLGGIARTRWLFQLNLIIYNVRHRALCTTFILFFFDRHFFDLFLFAYCTFRLHSTVTLINFPPRSRASSVKLQ